MRRVLVGIVLYLLSGCAAQVDNPPKTQNAQTAAVTKETPHLRSAHSGVREKLGYYYSINPDCSVAVYPEIRVVKAPTHGTISIGQGDDYPNVARDNVRYECNRKLAGSTELFYESNPDFRGQDSFVVGITWAYGTYRADTYAVEVH